MSFRECTYKTKDSQNKRYPTYYLHDYVILIKSYLPTYHSDDYKVKHIILHMMNVRINNRLS